MSEQTLNKSISGVSHEINSRMMAIASLVKHYTGDPDRFLHPAKDKMKLVRRGLELWREVKRLRIIRAELYLIKELKP